MEVKKWAGHSKLQNSAVFNTSGNKVSRERNRESNDWPTVQASQNENYYLRQGYRVASLRFWDWGGENKTTYLEDFDFFFLIGNYKNIRSDLWDLVTIVWEIHLQKHTVNPVTWIYFTFLICTEMALKSFHTLLKMNHNSHRLTRMI